jgi:hypothetical protein
MKKILVMGLPGSGKTTLSKELYLQINSKEFNADEVRASFNDWDFSNEGRIRQAFRMNKLCQSELDSGSEFVIADFVCPTKDTREAFAPDFIVWMDTIDQSIYEDTNKIFQDPESYDFRVNRKDSVNVSEVISKFILSNQKRPVFNSKATTAQMLGRYQPWHAGHRALFEEALKRAGQVCIMVRSTGGNDSSNPLSEQQVVNLIKKDLDFEYQGMYKVLVVPNITNIYYGRDVGYSIEQIHLPEDIQNISATKIRQSMGI